MRSPQDIVQLVALDFACLRARDFFQGREPERADPVRQERCYTFFDLGKFIRILGDDNHPDLADARTTYGEKKWPWDRRGEVYIRYGEPDYRSNSQELNVEVPLKIQRIQEFLAYKLYGEKALGMTFVGPVFPIRTEQTVGSRFRDFGVNSSETINEIGLVEWKPVIAGYDPSAVPWEVWIYANIDNGLEVVFTDESLKEL